MTKVIPAIIAKNFKHIEEKVSKVKDFVDVVQVDIVDGIFVPKATWPYVGDEGELAQLVSQEMGLPFWEDVDYEFHLMIEKPEATIGQWIAMGASRIIVQIETVTDMNAIIEECKASQVQVGTALKPSTDNSVLTPWVEKIDCIQCMGNDILGRHGVPLEQDVLEKIHTLRTMYPDMEISIDIGVNKDTVAELVDAGVTTFVAGSAVFEGEGSIEQNISELSQV